MFSSRLCRTALNRIVINSATSVVYDWIMPAKTLGARGERAAERFLLRKGLIIVGRGYQDKFAEIDLIAVDDTTIVFVEVKTRTSDVADEPAEAVDQIKQQRITKAALHYLRQHKLLECAARFDVVAIIWPPVNRHPKIQHIENAFEPADKFQMFS